MRLCTKAVSLRWVAALLLLAAACLVFYDAAFRIEPQDAVWRRERQVPESHLPAPRPSEEEAPATVGAVEAAAAESAAAEAAAPAVVQEAPIAAPPRVRPVKTFPPLRPRLSPYRAATSPIHAYCSATDPLLLHRNSTYPFISQESFRELADFAYDRSQCEIDPWQVTTGSIIAVHSVLARSFFQQIQSRLSAKYVLITGQDYRSMPLSVLGSTDAVDSEDSAIMHWFTVHYDAPPHRRISPIPLGLPTSVGSLSQLELVQMWSERFGHDPEAVRERFREKLQPLFAKWPGNTLMLVDFALHTNVDVRTVAQTAAQRLGFSSTSFERYEEHLDALLRSQFALCPPSSGPDSHRVWEALLAGAVPVVRAEMPLRGLFRDLPVVEVGDWHQLTMDFLEQQRDDLLFRLDSFDFRSLYMDYWMEAVYQAAHPTAERTVPVPELAD